MNASPLAASPSGQLPTAEPICSAGDVAEPGSGGSAGHHGSETPFDSVAVDNLGASIHPSSPAATFEDVSDVAASEMESHPDIARNLSETSCVASLPLTRPAPLQGRTLPLAQYGTLAQDHHGDMTAKTPNIRDLDRQISADYESVRDCVKRIVDPEIPELLMRLSDISRGGLAAHICQTDSATLGLLVQRNLSRSRDSLPVFQHLVLAALRQGLEQIASMQAQIKQQVAQSDHLLEYAIEKLGPLLDDLARRSRGTHADKAVGEDLELHFSAAVEQFSPQILMVAKGAAERDMRRNDSTIDIYSDSESSSSSNLSDKSNISEPAALAAMKRALQDERPSLREEVLLGSEYLDEESRHDDVDNEDAGALNSDPEAVRESLSGASSDIPDDSALHHHLLYEELLQWGADEQCTHGSKVPVKELMRRLKAAEAQCAELSAQVEAYNARVGSEHSPPEPSFWSRIWNMQPMRRPPAFAPPTPPASDHDEVFSEKEPQEVLVPAEDLAPKEDVAPQDDLAIEEDLASREYLALEEASTTYSPSVESCASVPFEANPKSLEHDLTTATERCCRCGCKSLSLRGLVAPWQEVSIVLSTLVQDRWRRWSSKAAKGHGHHDSRFCAFSLVWIMLECSLLATVLAGWTAHRFVHEFSEANGLTMFYWLECIEVEVKRQLCWGRLWWMITDRVGVDASSAMYLAISIWELVYAVVRRRSYMVG